MKKFELELFVALIFGILSAAAVSGIGEGAPDAKINDSDRNLDLDFPDSPLIVNDSTLGQYLLKYSSFILDCWEPGCNPCSLIDPKIDQMAKDFRGQVVFGKLNIKQNIKTMVKYRVFNYPTLLIFTNGSMIYRHIGNYPISTLEEIISKKLELCGG